MFREDLIVHCHLREQDVEWFEIDGKIPFRKWKEEPNLSFSNVVA